MVIETDIEHIRAYDNVDVHERVVVNYSSKSYSDSLSTWSMVDKFFVYCNGTGFYVDMQEFKITTTDELVVDELKTESFVVYELGREGQREIKFETKFEENSVKILFLSRNRLIRVVENTFDVSKLKGSLYARTHTKLNSIGYIEKI